MECPAALADIDPWGSGEDPYQNSKNFLSYVNELRKEGMTDTEIAKGLGVSTRQLKLDRTIANNEIRAADQAQAVALKDKRYSNVAIGARMGIGESQVRSLLKQASEGKVDQLKNTADKMKEQLEKGDYIDIGEGTQLHMGVSKQTKDAAVAMLEDQGYTKHVVKVPQLGTDHETTVLVMAKEGDYTTVRENAAEHIRVLDHYSEDNGRTFGKRLHEPQNVSSDRIAVRYAEEGGEGADGTMYIRPGVEDLDLGASSYAQVRIAVDGTHYLKGVAIPKDGLPNGTDIVFNTNKSSTGNKLDALKPMKTNADGTIDKDNPFGSSITRQQGAMNIVNEEGSWGDWSRNLSSQMLSKQSVALAKQQLDMAYKNKRAEFDEVSALTNPTVKQFLLDKFADGADASAVHLKAAALPRQVNRVLIPVETMKDNEIYSPSHRNGETVALVRHPHGGIFEIPELVVNNRHREAKSLLGDAKDAVGINGNVAQRLSGADFDGDAVLVIPNDSGAVRTSPSLKALEDFDPQRNYPKFEGMKTIDSGTVQADGSVTYGPKGPIRNNAQKQMGEVSNLITDMTIKGAPQAEIARAVKHSMVVIDAEKHQLNHKQSEIDNGIKQLKDRYQKDPANPNSRGASTIVSRASATTRVPERKPRPASEGGAINPDGSVAWVPTGRGFNDKNTGEWVPRQTKTTRMAEVRDARELSSGEPIEEAYASHANNLKSLANEARREIQRTKPTPYEPSAREAYRPQVDSLRSKLNEALKNAPLERQAQLLGNANVAAKERDNPGMTRDELKKVKGQALEEARIRTGAKKQRVVISDDEWEAIQSGATSTQMLKDLLKNADLDRVKELATPRSNRGISPAIEARARAMLSGGYTQAEIADALGISTSTVAAL